jgi:hypothetical protein
LIPLLAGEGRLAARPVFRIGDHVAHFPIGASESVSVLSTTSGVRHSGIEHEQLPAPATSVAVLGRHARPLRMSKNQSVHSTARGVWLKRDFRKEKLVTHLSS